MVAPDARCVVLAVATVVTALVAEILVGSLEAFAEQVGLTEFFVAAVIVAIVGNAAEHGGAVVVAHRGKIKLAAEIALASAAQVAVFLIPAVALLSWLIDPLALGFRPVEIAALAGALAVTVITLWGGRPRRAARRGAARRLRGGRASPSTWPVTARISSGLVRERGRRPRHRIRREVELRSALPPRRGRRGAARRARGPRRSASDRPPRASSTRRVGPPGRRRARPQPAAAPGEHELRSPPSTTGRARRDAVRCAVVRPPRVGRRGAPRARPPRGRARAPPAAAPAPVFDSTAAPVRSGRWTNTAARKPGIAPP